MAFAPKSKYQKYNSIIKPELFRLQFNRNYLPYKITINYMEINLSVLTIHLCLYKKLQNFNCQGLTFMPKWIPFIFHRD